MVVLTISGVLGIIGAGVTAVASAAAFLANIATIPFTIAGNNRTLAVVIYWVVFAIDSFVVVPLVSSVLQPFFDIFGLEGVKIGFTTIYLLIINIFTSFLFNWAFVPFHLLILASLVLALELVIFMVRTKSISKIMG